MRENRLSGSMQGAARGHKGNWQLRPVQSLMPSPAYSTSVPRAGRFEKSFRNLAKRAQRGAKK
ncbi:MAG: hypothetical protein JWR26_2280 [Pedosphaera sp.]|nr:hypothetical protein [Pedosphaera sp.]